MSLNLISAIYIPLPTLEITWWSSYIFLNSCTQIIFPLYWLLQVWKGQGSRKWKHGQSDGFFVQFETPSVRKLWFVPSANEKGQSLCRSLSLYTHKYKSPSWGDSLFPRKYISMEVWFVWDWSSSLVFHISFLLCRDPVTLDITAHEVFPRLFKQG